MENVHFDVRIRHSTANTLSDFKACDRQFVPAIGTGTLPFGCPGCSAVSGAGWLTFGGFDEGHLYRLERQPRGLFLRSCAKFRWDICRGIRGRSNGSTINGTGGSPGPNTANALSKGTTGNNLGAPQTSGAGSAPASHGNAVDTPAAKAATQSLGNTDAGVLKK